MIFCWGFLSYAFSFPCILNWHRPSLELQRNKIEGLAGGCAVFLFALSPTHTHTEFHLTSLLHILVSSSFPPHLSPASFFFLLTCSSSARRLPPPSIFLFFYIHSVLCVCLFDCLSHCASVALCRSWKGHPLSLIQVNPGLPVLRDAACVTALPRRPEGSDKSHLHIRVCVWQVYGHLLTERVRFTLAVLTTIYKSVMRSCHVCWLGGANSALTN